MEPKEIVIVGTGGDVFMQLTGDGAWRGIRRVQIDPRVTLLSLTLSDEGAGIKNVTGVSIDVSLENGPSFSNRDTDIGLYEAAETSPVVTRHGPIGFCALVHNPSHGYLEVQVEAAEGSPFTLRVMGYASAPATEPADSRSESTLGQFLGSVMEAAGTDSISLRTDCEQCQMDVVIGLLVSSLLVLLAALGVAILSLFFPPLLALAEILTQLGIIIAIGGLMELIAVLWARYGNHPGAIAHEICKTANRCF